MLSAEAMPILVLGAMDRPDSIISAQLEATGVLGARIPPGTVSISFRLGLAMGAAIAGLFPLAYVALVALATWAVCSIVLRHGVVLGATSGIYSHACRLLCFSGRQLPADPVIAETSSGASWPFG
jgi:hypothetical protein